MIHNIELHPGKGGQLVRSAGNGAQLMAKEGKYATLTSSIWRDENGSDRMPCNRRYQSANGDHNLINLGKAGT